MIIFGKLHENPGGNLPLSAFIASVYISLAAKDVCDILLPQVVVNPKILQALIFHKVVLLPSSSIVYAGKWYLMFCLTMIPNGDIIMLEMLPNGSI